MSALSPRFPVPLVDTERTGSFEQVAGGFSPPVDEGGALPLFRPEALAAAASNGLGKPIAVLPLTWGFLTLALLIVIGLAATFLLTGNYTRKESVRGIVRMPGGEVRIGVPSPGVVRTVHVAEGEAVRAGQVLLTIDTGRIGTDGAPIDAVSLATLNAEITDLTQRVGAIGAAARIEADAAPQRRGALERELSAARAQERSGRERLTLAQDALDRVEPVARKGFISGESMRRRREEVIALRQAVTDSQATQARLQGQLAELGATVAQQPMNVIQQKGELLDRIARAQRERDSIRAQRGFVVRAPADGTVTALQVSAGQSVDPQSAPMTISGARSRMIAELFVPSRSIGFVQPGQRVRIRYDAFPYQRFGTGSGHVAAISSTVMRPQDVEAAVRLEEPAYRVTLAIDRETIGAYGTERRIRTGFALSADIVLDERSFGEWLLDPLLALKGRM